MNARQRRRSRSGSVLVFIAIAMVATFAVIAFAVDIGYLNVVRSQIQSSADSAALAAAWDLVGKDTAYGEGSDLWAILVARYRARQYAGYNKVTGDSPNLAFDDIYVGRLETASSEMCFDDWTRYNAVRVRVRRTDEQNGAVSTFFARVLGIDSANCRGEATAMFIDNFGGFTAPSDGSNLDMLPYALDLETWNDLMAGNGDDDFGWDEENEAISSGADGVLEVNLFPQGTGSPGNRGTVDIGSSNNSTNDIARQIVEGVSAEDLEHHGGSLEFDCNRELFLNGDTGISAGVKDELASIKGQPRIIPIFSDVSGNGNNAMYTIVKFVGIRIMDVKLTGKMSTKRVIIQPAQIETKGGIPATGDQVSNYIHSAVWLVR